VLYNGGVVIVLFVPMLLLVTPRQFLKKIISAVTTAGWRANDPMTQAIKPE